MLRPVLPDNENARLSALREFQILDTDFEPAYDDLTVLTAQICGTPIALISLVDADRQWFKSAVGLAVRQTSRELSLCAHAIHQTTPFIVPDTQADERFFDNPLVTGEPKIRFYAGIPLISREGYALGTLCALDRQPRQLTPEQLNGLRILTDQVLRLLELRRTTRHLEQLNLDKSKVFSLIAHDLRTPFTGLVYLTELLRESWNETPGAEIQAILTELHLSAASTYRLLNSLLSWADLETGRLRYRPVAVPLADVVEDLRLELRGVFKAKQLTFAVSLPLRCQVQSDRTMLKSILGNLISNAVKFTPVGGCVAVEALAVEQRVVIQVTDTGVGLTDDQHRLLNQVGGLRSTAGTDGEVGSGLGLTLTHKFLAHLGSQLRVTSQAGAGSQFAFEVPAAGPAEGEPGLTSPS